MSIVDLNILFEDKTFENKRRKPEEYNEITKQIREDIIKTLVLAKSGHTGGSLGITDVLSVLYFGGNMRYDASNWQWEGRDRFVLSAGHMTPVLYSTLVRAGYFSAQELLRFRKLDSRLQGHPGFDMKLPGVETSSGSLGQGVSIALGMAFAQKLIDKSDQVVFSITGDGELQEGTCWEVAMSAGTHKIDNFCWIVDNNDCQIDGRVKDIMSIYPLADKFRAFNFEVIEIDGHNLIEIIDAFDKFHENHKKGIGKPTCIIAKTLMGRGVSFMEDSYKWHGIPPSPEQAIKALEELNTK